MPAQRTSSTTTPPSRSPVIRNEIGIELVQSGLPPDAARCVAGRIADAYSVEGLSAADPAQFQTDSFIQQVQGYVQECAPG